MNLHFEILLEEFKEWLFLQSKAKRTIKEYPFYAEKFLLFLEEEKVFEVQQITPQHIASYHSFLLEKEYAGQPLSISTVRNRLVQLRTFFRFLFDCEKIYIDPMAHYKLPKFVKHLPRNIPEVWQISKILKAVDFNTPLGIRDWVIVVLLYGSGLRSEELRYLKLDQVRLKSGDVLVFGKGGKEAVVPLTLGCQKALSGYLLFSRPHLLKGNKGAPLYKGEDSGNFVFLSKNGRRLSSANLRDLLHRLCHKAGLETSFSAHSFRHACATHLLRNGADLRHIQKLLRHEDLNTTQIYTKVDVEDLKEAQKKYHPLENLKQKRNK